MDGEWILALFAEDADGCREGGVCGVSLKKSAIDGDGLCGLFLFGEQLCLEGEVLLGAFFGALGVLFDQLGEGATVAVCFLFECEEGGLHPVCGDEEAPCFGDGVECFVVLFGGEIVPDQSRPKLWLASLCGVSEGLFEGGNGGFPLLSSGVCACESQPHADVSGLEFEIALVPFDGGVPFAAFGVELDQSEVDFASAGLGFGAFA